MTRLFGTARPAILAITSIAAGTPAFAADYLVCVPDYVLQAEYDPATETWTRSNPASSESYVVVEDGTWSVRIEGGSSGPQTAACPPPEGDRLTCHEFDFDFAQMVFVRIVGTDFEDGAPATTARIETGTCRPANLV